MLDKFEDERAVEQNVWSRYDRNLEYLLSVTHDWRLLSVKAVIWWTLKVV